MPSLRVHTLLLQHDKTRRHGAGYLTVVVVWPLLYLRVPPGVVVDEVNGHGAVPLFAGLARDHESEGPV